MNLSWFFLIIAGIFEIGWPLGFKLSQVSAIRWLWIAMAVASMALSGYFLWMAQKEIPIGTAYAVWTGIGAAGTFLIGMIFFRDPVTVVRMVSFLLIIAGVIGLRIAHA